MKTLLATVAVLTLSSTALADTSGMDTHIIQTQAGQRGYVTICVPDHTASDQPYGLRGDTRNVPNVGPAYLNQPGPRSGTQSF